MCTKAERDKSLPFTSNLRLFIMWSGVEALRRLRFDAASLYRSHYKYQFQIIDHKRIYYPEVGTGGSCHVSHCAHC